MLLRRRRHISLCQRRWWRCISLSQRPRRRIPLGQRLLGYLVEIPQSEPGRDRKHPRSTTQPLEQLRSRPKGNHPLSVLWRNFLWLHFPWRHFRSRHIGSHATFGHEQWYILYYYYSKEKKAVMYFRLWRHFRSRDFVWRHFRSEPLPVTSLPVTHA
jgi:hypothetical protein